MSGPAPHHDRVSRSFEMEERLVACLLDDLHLGGSTLGRAVQADEHLLRADAELELLRAESSRGRATNGPAWYTPSTFSSGQDVHRRAADELPTKRFAGLR